MSSLRLTTVIDSENPTLHDLMLVNGQIQWIGLDTTDQDVTRDMMRQRVLTSYQHLKGEFFADLRKGFPYLEQIFTKNPSTAKVKSLLRRYTEQIPGVASATIETVELNSATRTMTVSGLLIRTDAGFILTYQAIDVPWLVLKDEVDRG